MLRVVSYVCGMVGCVRCHRKKDTSAALASANFDLTETSVSVKTIWLALTLYLLLNLISRSNYVSDGLPAPRPRGGLLMHIFYLT